MTESPPNDVEGVLNHYGNQIPEGVAASAARYRNRDTAYPKRVLKLRDSDGCRLGNVLVTVKKPRSEDGLLVKVADDEHSEYWAVPETVLGAFVYKLTTETELVAVSVHDDFEERLGRGPCDTEEDVGETLAGP